MTWLAGPFTFYGMAQAKKSEGGGKQKSAKAERARLAAAVDAAKRAVDAFPENGPYTTEQEKSLWAAFRRRREAQRTLAAFDQRLAKQRLKTKKTAGRGESRVGLIKVSRERKVGDSQAVHRKRNVFRKK